MINLTKKYWYIGVLTLLFLLGGFFYFHYEVFYSISANTTRVSLEISRGDGIREVAEKLIQKKLISGKIYFYYYLKTRKLSGSIFPGDYSFDGGMTIPEVAEIITGGKENIVRVTFPEGWDSQKMAERLSGLGFPGNDFLNLVKNPENLVDKYELLREDKVINLEGYLFPDTYFFKKDASADEIIEKMLDNFSTQFNSQIISDTRKNGKTVRQIIIMASIIEKEVDNDTDRKLVSGLFWNRLADGQALQSCATIAFALSKNKDQFSFEDTRVNSPYNTYINKGLPPGPICNPGFSSIQAAVYPEKSDYYYFLSDPKTGKTVFSKTLEEHNENKVKYGL